MSLIWSWWKSFEKNNKLTTENAGKPFVVVGFQRSGTSLVCDLLNKAGVYFGEQNDLMESDPRNPNGFFEHKTIFKLSRALLNQAGYQYELPEAKSLRAKGAFNKARRIMTRRKMLTTLKTLSQGHEKWGFKNFPIHFHFWKQYVPKPVVIGVYRDPLVVAESFMKAWKGGFFTTEQVMQYWALANKDLMYHVTTSGGFLIKYEDLFDPGKQLIILQKIVDAVGSGSVEELKAVLDPNLNRSSKNVAALQSTYPLQQDVKDVLEALEKMKV